MSKKRSALDVDELLMFAVRAIRQNKPEQAMKYTKRALKTAPDNAQAHHVLGGLHASNGDFDQAVGAMNRAVELDPDLSVARFQLGLLHLTSGRIPEASAIWDPLDTLGEDHPLYLFKKGMLHLVKNEFQQCIDTLERGIPLNTENAALNKDMQKVVERARQALQ